MQQAVEPVFDNKHNVIILKYLNLQQILFTYFKIHGKNKLKRCGVKTAFGEMWKFFLIIYILFIYNIYIYTHSLYEKNNNKALEFNTKRSAVEGSRFSL